MNDFLATLGLALLLVVLTKYAQRVVGTYQRGSSFFKAGPMSRNMANRRVWGVVLIGAAAVLIWAFLLIEKSPLMRGPGLWAYRAFTGTLPYMASIYIFRRALAMAVIAAILGVTVIWMLVLAVADVFEILRRAQAYQAHKRAISARLAQQSRDTKEDDSAQKGG